MCMWVFGGARINFDRITAFELHYPSPSHLSKYLHCRVWSLCNQLLIQFSVDHFETMHTCCGYIEDVHVNFYRRKINFDKITAFWT